MKMLKSYELPVIREVGLRDVTYSVVTLVNKTVMYV